MTSREFLSGNVQRGAIARVVCALAAAMTIAAPGAHAQVFNWFDPIIDISDTTTGSWVDIDVSANVPAGATGVMVEVKTEGSSDDEFAIRKNGSSDEWMWGPTTIKNDTHTWFMIGVDSNRVFEVKQGDNDIDMYLLGYTTGGVTFFDNAYNKTTSGAGWEDVDISTETGTDTAIAAIFIIHNTGNSQNWSIRMNDADEDGDGGTGTISDDSDDGTDPTLGNARFVVTAAADTPAVGQTTLTSSGRSGEARRKMEAVLEDPP
jgi:hypothetical protein